MSNTESRKEDLMIPYSLEPDRNRVDPRAGIVPDSVDLDAPFREPLARLATAITDRAAIKLGKEKITKESPEYWGIYNLITDEQCEIALKMEKRKPKTFDQGCADDEEGWCIAVCDMAEWVVETNKGGRYITREEALKILKKAEDNGFVHQITNIDGEDACTRGTIDEALAIDEVKKFIAMQDMKSSDPYVAPKVVPKILGDFDEKVAIIGAGPAGISCAYYLAEKGYKPTLFEKNKKPGGMVTYGIPSFVMEKDIVEAEVDILRKMGVDIRLGVEVGKDITI